MTQHNPRSQRKLTDARSLFLQQVVAVARAIPGLKVIGKLPDAYGFSVDPGDGQRLVFLENLFAETRGLPPEERPAAIRHFLNQLAVGREPNFTWEEARPRLRVALRAAMPIGPPRGDPGLEPACREVLPCLREHLVIRHDHAIAFLRRVDVQRWGRPDDEIYRTAHANMQAEASTGISLVSRHPSPIWRVEGESDHDGSRLLIPGFLASFAGRVDGRPIAVVPHRAALIIAGDRDPRTVLRLSEMALREYAASSRSVSFAVYSVDESGALVPYERAVADDAADRIREAQMQFVRAEYDRQKLWLEEHRDGYESDVYVANFLAMISDEHGVMSSCVWDYDKQCLLPKTGFVALALDGREQRELALFRWDDVARIAGDELKPEPGLFPARWRTPRGPLAREKLAQLRELQVPLQSLATA